MGDIAILDADSIAYKLAAANEKKTITTTHIETQVVEHWDNRTAFRKYLKDTTHTEDQYTIEDVQDARHISYAKTAVQAVIEKQKNLARCTSYELYISGENNFRDAILLPQAYTQNNATQSVIGGQYKSNRDGSIRPVQLKELRAWMIQELGAIVVNDMEVDDMASIRAYEGYLALCKDKNAHKVVNVTGDKDALGSCGMLLNPDKMDRPVLIQGFGELHREGKDDKDVKGTGRLWLYFQSLFGDKVDGYRPVDIADINSQKSGGKKIEFGQVAAYNLLKDCKTDKEAWEVLYKQYQSWYSSPTQYTSWDGVERTADAVEIMQLYVDCAHMKRFKDDRIIVRDVLTKLEII